MPSRRPHSKSHHGCDQCKQRRIKCDEVHPACGSCRRKNLACVFQSVGPVLTPDPPSLAIANVPNDRTSFLPIQDLELMHHWHTATVDSLTNAKPLKDVVRVAMPQEGLRSPFLMHSLLAVAAVHLSRSTPPDRRQKYVEVAMTHHNQSLTLCTPFVNHITRQNCHALFAFSSLLPIFVFGSQTSRITPRILSLADVVETLKLMRGSASIVRQVKPWIEEGPMHPLLRVGKFHQPRDTQDGRARQLLAKFDELERDLPDPLSKEGSGLVHGAHLEALQELHHLFQIYVDTGDSRALMAWPALVDASYFDLLQQKQQLAVLVLGLFGLALEILSEQWWLEGTGQSLVALAVNNLPPIDRELLMRNSPSIAKQF
ncbi:hypothetical protein BJX64DRAFT_267131 [Aspergillus heterothallicus]